MDSVTFLLVLTVCASTVRVSLQGPSEQRLYGYLMKNYNKLVRPVFNESEVLTVKLGINLMQILDVDEKNQVLTTNIWLQLSWDDAALRWDPAEYDGLDSVRLPHHLIWRPDILLYNSVDAQFDGTFHTKTLITSSGTCTYIPPGILKSTCYIDVRWFPFDIQRCELKFGSWTYGGWSVDLQLGNIDLSSYTANGEWDLLEVPGQRNERMYECCLEPYPDVTFTIVMRRRTLFYGVNLLIPCILISTLALLVFLLPADSGEKVSLGITVLLALTVFMLLVAEIMPATSDSVPLIAKYFAITMVIVGLSVIATVVVLQYHHHDPDGSKMPKWTRVVLLEWCAWFLRMKRPSEERGLSVCDNKVPQSSRPNVELSSASALPSTNVPCGSQQGSDEEKALLFTGQSPSVLNVEPDLSKILDEVRRIAQCFREQDEKKAVCNEWKFAASVIDRLCLVAFSFVIILCTLLILTSAPNLAEAISKDLFS
ncbi:unnamed protein product [Lampetra planeri]